MELNNILFSLLLILFGYLLNKYLLLFLNKSKLNLLSDADYKKPQAFHEKKTYRLGGTTYFILLFLSSLYLFKSKNIYLSEYISFCSVFFILGLLDDLKIKILPKFRLFAMTGSLLILVIANELYIQKVGLEFLNYLLEIDIFSLIFIMLCFLFIINGSNLIDGYNGLLGIHSLIILLNLFLINFYNSNFDLANLIFFQIVTLLTFLFFNFPKAKIFLGDGGSYLLGAFIAISAIKTSIANPSISPFYFCILLFYVFFEVFFSFFRKLIREKKSPIHPDKKHLHMLLYQLLLKYNKDKLKSNYYVSIIINVVYFVLTIPAILMMQSGMFCKYYSLVFFLIYLFSYKKVYDKI